MHARLQSHIQNGSPKWPQNQPAPAKTRSVDQNGFQRGAFSPGLTVLKQSTRNCSSVQPPACQRRRRQQIRDRDQRREGIWAEEPGRSRGTFEFPAQASFDAGWMTVSTSWHLSEQPQKCLKVSSLKEALETSVSRSGVLLRGSIKPEIGVSSYIRLKARINSCTSSEAREARLIKSVPRGAFWAPVAVVADGSSSSAESSPPRGPSSRGGRSE